MTKGKKASKAKSAKPKKNPEKVRKGKTAIKKGKQFERDLANFLGHIFEDAKRHIESQSDEAFAGTDLEGTDIFQFQCKNYQGYVNPSKIFEIRLKTDKHVPVLVTKGNKLPPMAVLPLENFIHLLEIAYGIRPPYVSQCERGNSLVAMKAKALPPFNSVDPVAEMVAVHNDYQVPLAYEGAVDVKNTRSCELELDTEVISGDDFLSLI